MTSKRTKLIEQSKQSSRRSIAHYMCIARYVCVLLIVLYFVVSVFYLTNTTSLHSTATSSKPKDYTNGTNGSGEDIVYQRLRDAGVSMKYLQQIQSKLPTWDDIVQQYGSQPIIYNTESCSIYRSAVPPQRRVLGAAGIFNTGTNLVTQYLKQNCYIPERRALYGANATKEQLGIRWQVPWGKHTPSHYKYDHAASDKAATIHVNDVLPIITIRHPYRWIQSMCHHPYAAKWQHYTKCPNVINTKTLSTNPVTIQYGAGIETYESIPHLWNDWYHEYYQHAIREDTGSDHQYYPLLIVRMEDLIFHTKETITSICDCVGGKLYSKQKFDYIVTSAKGDSPGHDTTTDIVNAYIKYGRSLQINAGFDFSDYNATRYILNNNLMGIFHYHHPFTNASMQ
jgi:hypothetical protein